MAGLFTLLADRYQMVGFSSYLRFGHLTSGEASNILEVVTEQVNPHTEPMKFLRAPIRCRR